MASAFPISLNLNSPNATATLAAAIAPVLTAGDTLLLAGEIGAGKTHFARSLIQTRLATAGITEDVPSPTFTLVQTYGDGLDEIWHSDLYRLTDEYDVAELGLADAFIGAICLVEWPEKLIQLRPGNAMNIEFQTGADPDTRKLVFKTNAPKWTKLIPVLCQFDPAANTNV